MIETDKDLERLAWRVYDKESIIAKFHIMARAISCRFSCLIPLFPKTGSILDIGCGHGLLLYALHFDRNNHGRQLIGIDHAADKISIAARHAKGAIAFKSADVASFPDETFDTVSITGVLYSMPIVRWKETLDNCFRILKPGGKIILKEAVNRPKWKYRIMMCEEYIAMYLLSLTKGSRPHIESTDTYVRALGKSGFTVTYIKPVSWNWMSDCIFVAQKRE